MSYESDTQEFEDLFVDSSIKQNNILDDRNPDLEIMEHYNREVEEDEEDSDNFEHEVE